MELSKKWEYFAQEGVWYCFNGNEDRVADWYPSGRREITFVQKDGSRILYDCITHYMRYIRHSHEDALNDEDLYKKTFARRLRRIMDAQGVNSVKLSNKSGVSKLMISRYLNARAVPSAYNIARIANALGCSSSSLVEDIDYE